MTIGYRVFALGSVEEDVGSTKGSPYSFGDNHNDEGTLCLVKIPMSAGLRGWNETHGPRAPEGIPVWLLSRVFVGPPVLPQNHVRDVELKGQCSKPRRLADGK